MHWFGYCMTTAALVQWRQNAVEKAKSMWLERIIKNFYLFHISSQMIAWCLNTMNQCFASSVTFLNETPSCQEIQICEMRTLLPTQLPSNVLIPKNSSRLTSKHPKCVMSLHILEKNLLLLITTTTIIWLSAHNMLLLHIGIESKCDQ